MKTAPAGGMSVTGEDFEQSVKELISEIKPQKIIETGTYLGTGTTRILVEALEKTGLPYELHTIEANPAFCESANSLYKDNHKVNVINGYSLPKHMLPSEEALQKWLDSLKNEDIYVDFEEWERVSCYMAEGNHAVSGNFLKFCCRYFGYTPDLFMLDSSGHLGFLELQYILTMITGKCHFILDDVFHVKHFESLRYMIEDSRFSIRKVSTEKFGFCIAEYTP
jgi:hypothetical protein